MPHFLTPPRRTATPPPADTRPRLPAAPGPKPATVSRADTVAELREIYKLLDQEQIHTAKQRLITLGRNLQA
jgi:hypothetical protein